MNKFKVGDRCNWVGQAERLVYMGVKYYRGDHRTWHQFAKVEKPGVVWREVLTSDLGSIELTAAAEPEPLTPPDLERCQALIPTGQSFMTLGPRKARAQCESKPVVVAHENEPGPDGLKGSMSLCASCQKVMVAGLGEDFATFELIGAPVVAPFEFKRPEDTEGGSCD